MKSLLLFSAIALFAAACSPAVYTDIAMPQGYYAGSDYLFSTIFLKVDKDTAFADLVQIEKFPRNLHSDTLFYKDGKWAGASTQLFRKNGKYFVRMNAMKVKVRQDEVYYLAHSDQVRNSGMARSVYESMAGNDSTKLKHERLAEKYKLHEMINTMKHADFIKAFAAFRAELLAAK